MFLHSIYTLYIYIKCFPSIQNFLFNENKQYKIYVLCQLENTVFIHLGYCFTTGSTERMDRISDSS